VESSGTNDVVLKELTETVKMLFSSIQPIITAWNKGEFYASKVSQINSEHIINNGVNFLFWLHLLNFCSSICFVLRVHKNYCYYFSIKNNNFKKCQVNSFTDKISSTVSFSIP
jgi:hypothetical protein